MNVLERLGALHSAMTAQGYDVRPLVAGPVASPADVAQLEASLGVTLPPAFRDALTTISGHVEFRWFAPSGTQFPKPFHQSFSGDLHWSVEFTEMCEMARRSWVEEVFSNPEDAYDAVWHNKLAFYEVGNGDLLAFDLDEASPGRVVYLSHDDGEGHGFVLAHDFADLLATWVPLACAGGEDWQWLPFVTGPTSGLQPDGEAATSWRRVLGLGSARE